MITETKKVVALAGLIIAVGVGSVELTRDSAQADAKIVAGGAAGYAGKRVDGAFQLVSTLPATAALSISTTAKGDLMPVAYDIAAEKPAVVVEAKRGASSSILMRLSRITVAGF